MNVAQKWLDIGTLGIASVLTKGLRLPLNQREYSWEESHVTDLFSDLADAIVSRPTYFLGTMVITVENDQALVVDGQQRLATTTILLASIRDRYLLMGFDRLAQSIENEFLSVIDPSTGDTVPKLRMNHDDAAYFDNAIVKRPAERTEFQGRSLKSHRRIDTAARIAAERVGLIVSGTNEPLQRLLDWRLYLTGKAIVLEICPLSDMDAFRMFETLNDRGLKTSQVDMLKNYLFEQAAGSVEAAQVKWSTLRGSLESCAEDDILLSYMRHFTLAIYGPRRANQAQRSREHGDFYARIKNDVKGPKQSLEFVERMAKYADDYVAIVTPQHAKWNDYPSTVADALQVIVGELKVKQIRPLMLAVAACFDRVEAEKAFRAFVCWTVRFLISGGMRGQTLEDAYAGAAHEVVTGKVKKASELRDMLSDVIPNDKVFEASFRTATVSQGNLARYYLRAIESVLRKNESDSPELEPIRNPERVNLEHIMPENPDAVTWRVSDDDVQSLLNKIGNLTLMASKQNVKIGNSSFVDKKTAYAASSLRITNTIPKAFHNITEWNGDHIAARQAFLARAAVKTWPLSF